MLIMRQNPRTFLDRGTGGEDIVDQNDARRSSVAGPAPPYPRQFDRAAQVFEALFAVQMRLGRRRTHTFQGWHHRQTEQIAEVAGDFSGLVIMARLFTTPVQRHRHERPSFLKRLRQAWVAERFGRDARQIACDVDAALVLENVYQGAGVFTAGQNGSSELKGVAQVTAVGAHEIGLDVSFKHFPAGLTKGRNNARQGVVAKFTKIPTLPQGLLA